MHVQDYKLAALARSTQIFCCNKPSTFACFHCNLTWTAAHIAHITGSASNVGTADASQSQTVEDAIHQRDTDIRAYFDTHVLKHVLNPDHQKRSLALTREICGLKVAHQQQIAAHAAAKRTAGASAVQSVTLRQQLQV